MTVITRFAPSPTGLLHIGGARTALFNYLFAKRHNGKFLLRIEDTDKSRSTQVALDAIINGLQWLGLNWDDNIIYQSQRNELYYQAAKQLLAQGKAYYCFTPQEEIDKLRQEAINNKTHFIFKSPWRDANPSSYPKDIKPVIRLKIDNQGTTVIHDKLQGDVVIENSHLDDMVLVRADGSATYMLAVVVDDHDMSITHIIRGDDHLTNAARQIQLYQAFGWKVPVMVHIPLIHGIDGAKLSKRHGAVGIEAYKEMGYLPEALCSYLLRLGWAHGDEEMINLDRAKRIFDLEGLGASPAKLDFVKMQHVNAHYLRMLSDEQILEIITEELKIKHDYSLSEQELKCIKLATQAIKIRAFLVSDMLALATLYLPSYKIQLNDEMVSKLQLIDKSYINNSIVALSSLTEFNKITIQQALKEVASDLEIKIGELMIVLRILMTGTTASPSIFEMIEIIGLEASISRLNKIFLL